MRTVNVTPIFIAATLIVFCACRKKIETISSADSAVFGQWRYVSSSGGIAGGGDPGLTSDTWIEFTDYGKYFEFRGDKKIEKAPYEFRDGKCIHGNTHISNVITILNGPNISYSFRVASDTLFLDAEVTDGFSYIYIKK